MTEWTDKLPPLPQLGDDMPPPRRREEVLGFLAERRSSTAAQLGEPGPSPEEVDALLRLASRVPDHRRVHPFRFVVFEGDARARFGTVLRQAFEKAEPGASEEAAALEAERFTRAPVVVAVVASPDPAHKTPLWEQQMTAAAAAQNLLLAAGAAGYGAQWLTEWYAYDAHVADGTGLKADEKFVGFVYIGTATEAPKERARMEPAALTSRWSRPRFQD
jgi:nitroreductase